MTRRTASWQGGLDALSTAVGCLGLSRQWTTSPLPGMTAAHPLRDLRDTEVVGRRLITFGMGGMGFTMDGREFDPDRIDQRVRLGTVEEWTIRNHSPMDHPFHLHVWPMQVLDGAEPGSTEPLGSTSLTSPPTARSPSASLSRTMPGAPSTSVTSSTTRTSA